MAHFVRLRPSGFWTISTTVSPAEFEAFDERQFKSINGDDGGTWAPSSQIVLGGAGLRVTGPSRLDNATRIDVSGFFNLGAASVTEQVAGGIAVFYGEVQIKDAAASLDFVNGALLAVDTTAAPPVIEAELRMESGADVRLGPSSEIKTTNARTNSMFIPLHIVRRFPTAGISFANMFPVDWGYAMVDGTVGQAGTTTNTEWVVFAVPMLPPSATITQVQMVTAPNLLHSALPEQMPQIRLVRYTATGARTVVGTQADTSASTAAYETQHTTTLATTETAAGRWYVIEICGEYGANSVTGMQLDSVILTYTTTRANHQHFEVTLA